MKVKVLIVEDELIIAEDMRDMLEELGYDVTGVTGEPDEALRLMSATTPDIVLVDITLGTAQLGLNLADRLLDEFKVPFIFCTSHADPDTVKKATQLKPNGYLVKPFNKEDLFSSIELALANYSEKSAPKDKNAKSEDFFIKNALFIKEGHLYVKVLIDNILWISPDGNYSTIFEKDSKKHVLRMPLKELHENLPENRFFRVHRSYVVNLEHIDAINNQNIIVNGESLPLGKNYRDELLSVLRKMH